MPSLSFSNPFQQYAGGVIPGWEYGGEATLACAEVMLGQAVEVERVMAERLEQAAR